MVDTHAVETFPLLAKDGQDTMRPSEGDERAGWPLVMWLSWSLTFSFFNSTLISMLNPPQGVEAFLLFK